jgi:uncharacterized DUF497 family protein
MSRVEWNREKAAGNFKKHKVAFEEASTVFGDEFAHTLSDPVHSFGEDRYIEIGRSNKRRTLVVVYTMREDTIRIISAREATKHERRYYEERS